MGILLSAAMMSAMVSLPVTTYADGEYASESDFTFDSSTGKITGYQGSDTVVSIPPTIGGVQVTGIADFAFYYSGIEYLTIPEGVTSIDELAFLNSFNIISITIPSTVENLSEGLFENHYALEEINIDPENAYYSSEDGVLFDKNKTDLLFYPQNKKDESYTIPSSVNEISATIRNHNLVSVTIPGNVEYIRLYGIEEQTPVFELTECYALAEINIAGDNPNYSSENGVVFNKDKTILLIYPPNKKDSSYVVPDSVSKINAYVFYDNHNSAVITIPKGIKMLTGNFWYCNNMDVIITGDTVVTGDIYDNVNTVTFYKDYPDLLYEGTNMVDSVTDSGSDVSVEIVSRRNVQTNNSADFYDGDFVVAQVSGDVEGKTLYYKWSGKDLYTGSVLYTDTTLQETAFNKPAYCKQPYLMIGSNETEISVDVYEAEKLASGKYILHHLGSSRTYTTSTAYDDAAMKAKTDNIKAFMMKGERLTISQLLGRAGLGHVYQCCNISNAIETESGNNVISLSDLQTIHDTDHDETYQDYYITANQTGVEKFKYDLQTSTCDYHGTSQVSSQTLEVDVVSTSSTTTTITLYDVIKDTEVRCIERPDLGYITAGADKTVTFEGLDPDTWYSFEFFSLQENNVLNPCGIIYEKTKPIISDPFTTSIRLIGNNQGSYENESNERYGKRDNGALGVITTITNEQTSALTVNSITWDITSTAEAFTSPDFNDERANQNKSFTKQGSDFANITLEENASVAVILLIDEIYDLNSSVSVTVE